ncbi:MAG: type II toxin-antitoxin system VapC family toxin [Xanthomonadaceae bacterium]|nr:type II toxin-antitoxin system VapC family toxin [Xanthomonadaceae bacterium]
MTARYLLDTNICIYIAREKPAEVAAKFAALQPGEAAISVITWGELRFGAEKSTRRRAVLAMLDEFASLVPVMPMARGAGDRYAGIRGSLESSGTPIGNNDLWIAAHALAADMTLITNNGREFRRVDGLRVDNWVKG